MEEYYSEPDYQFEGRDPAIVSYLKKIGIAKTTEQANMILLISAGVIFAISIFLFARAFSGPPAVEPEPEGQIPFSERLNN